MALSPPSSGLLEMPEMDSTRKSVASATFALSPMNLISSQ